MRRPLAVLTTILIALQLAVAPTHADVRFNPHAGQLDLLLRGFGVYQTNLGEDVERLFDSSDELPAEFTNRQVLNLRMDGAITELIEVEGRLHFDRENLRDWRYLMRLSGDDNEVAFGELDGAFEDTTFTHYATPFYGLEARVGVGPLVTQAFSTTRDGSYRVDRLRGNDLSGPYILRASPVLEGSERVAIEVRDRRDQEEIVRSDFKQPGLDYRIDYATGTVLFTEPIESRTFDGDPVFVVVEYRFESGDSTESSLLTGARVALEPIEGMHLGTTYLRTAGTSDGVSAIDSGLLGLDQRLRLGWLELENEMTGPQRAVLDRRQGAWRFAARAKPHSSLQLGARFRRVGKDFVTTPNPTLDSEIDRQSFDVDLSFLPHPAHRLDAGFGHKSDDVAGDPELADTSTRTWFASWEARIASWPLLRFRFEDRRTDGPGSFGDGTSILDTLTFDVEDEIGSWPMLGPTTLRAQYRLELIDEVDERNDDRRGHYVGVRVDAQPREPLTTFAEARVVGVRGTNGSTNRSRGLELLVGGRYRIDRKLTLGASVRRRQDRNETVEVDHSNRTAAVFDFAWEPSDRLKALVKYEWTLSRASSTSETRDRNVFARVVIAPVEAMTLKLGYQLDDQLTELGGRDGNRNGEYFASALYRPLERLTLFLRAERGRSVERLPPFTSTETIRNSAVVGASVDLTSRWGVLSELKRERYTGAIDARRRAWVVELSRKLNERLRLGGGVELALDEEGDAARLDRERVYLKLIGIL